METTKLCVKCQTEQPIENFGKNSKTRDGLRHDCRTCVKQYNKERYLSQTDHIKSTVLDWQTDNIDKVYEYQKTYRAKNKKIEISQ